MLWRLWSRCNESNVPLLASAVAFYAMLSIFPAFGVLISAYGLIADPQSVEALLASTRGVLPAEALHLMSDQLHGIVEKNNSELGIGLLGGLVLTLWSARAAAAAIMSALNMIYRKTDRRSLFVQQLVALAFTLGAIAMLIVTLIAVAVVPAVLAFVPLGTQLERLLFVLHWPLAAAIAAVSFALVYRFAPYRTRARWPCIAAGAVMATVLWLGGSAAFSGYAASLGSFDQVYGSLGAVVLLLMWFYVSALALLFGAVTDAELEHRPRVKRANAIGPALGPVEIVESPQEKGRID